MEDNICRVPVAATYEIIDGKAIMTHAVYEDIPADLIARYIMRKMGGRIPGMEQEGANA